jgi:hypothetical protein
MRRHLLARGGLVLRVGRQQQPRLEEGQPRRHDEVIGRELDPQALGPLDEIEVLLRQLQHRHLPQVDLLRAAEREQQVERPLEAVDIHDQ